MTMDPVIGSASEALRRRWLRLLLTEFARFFICCGSFWRDGYCGASHVGPLVAGPRAPNPAVQGENDPS
jgi:hypothetical protein